MRAPGTILGESSTTIDSGRQSGAEIRPAPFACWATPEKENRLGNPGLIPDYPLTPAARAGGDRRKFASRTGGYIISPGLAMDKQLWVTLYHPTERYPEEGLPEPFRPRYRPELMYAKDDESLTSHDDVVLDHRQHGTHAWRAPKSGRSCRPVGARAAQSRGTSLTETPTLGEEKVIFTGGEIRARIFTASSRLAGGGDRRPPVVQRLCWAGGWEVVGRRARSVERSPPRRYAGVGGAPQMKLAHRRATARVWSAAARITAHRRSGVDDRAAPTAAYSASSPPTASNTDRCAG